MNEMKKLTEKSSKKSLIDKTSERLLKLEFKSNHCIKLRALKCVVKKYCHYYKTCKLIVYIVENIQIILV